jgi:collagen type VII alpha
MATSGLYGSSPSGAVVAAPGAESAGLYGNTTNFGGTYFEWFIFKEASTAPATPTGGSWNFTTNVGTPPAGWLVAPPTNPSTTVWFCISLVNSRNTAALVWTAPAPLVLQGPAGTAATIAAGTTTTGAAGTSATVSNSGTSSAAVFNFTIPRGDTGTTGATGATGTAATVGVGTTTTGAPGSSANVTNSGTTSAATFNFTIPRGDVGATGATGATGSTGATGTAATIAAGTTTTGAAGTSASVTNSGTSSAAVFDFTIPQGNVGATGATGATGTAATIAAGTTTTGAAGTAATVTNVGSSSAAVFNFSIPQGAGVLAGGNTGQFLAKASNASYDTTWLSITGGLSYQGLWNASTNTPTLTSSVGVGGTYYVVSVSGSTNLDGVTDWVVGDWAIFNGTTWQKIDQTNLVTSVNGQTGAVVLTAANVGALATATSSDASIVVTQVGTNIDLTVSNTSPASVVVEQVRNTTGATLTKGTAVYISGATGQIPTVSKALATSDATSAQTLGLITADIANNSNGFVTIIGLVANLNTSAYTDGAQLYLSPTTAGTLTATKPYAPQHLVYMAVVAHAHPTQGKLLVKVQNGYELDEIHNVSAQSPTTGQTIVWNSATNLWEKNTVSLTAGVNGTLPVLNGGTGQTTYTDGQLLIGNSTGNTLTKSTLTAGSGISIVNSAGAISISATGSGTVTSVTGTSPVVSSGGATPDISLASGYGDTQNPYASKSANYVLAGPNGSAGVPTFRAIVAADIPTLNQNTTGTAGNVTGIVAVANGGSGTATPSLVAGTNITVTGSWPNQTITSTGGSSATPITQNLDQVTSNQTIAVGSNGFSVGPITVASGFSVTVASGQRWVII